MRDSDPWTVALAAGALQSARQISHKSKAGENQKLLPKSAASPGKLLPERDNQACRNYRHLQRAPTLWAAASTPPPKRWAMSAGPRISSALIRPVGGTTPIQLRPCMLLWMHADMGALVGLRLRLDRLVRKPDQRPAEPFLHRGEELLEAPGILHVLEPCRLAVWYGRPRR